METLTNSLKIIGIKTLDGEKLGSYLVEEGIRAEELSQAYFEFEQYLLEAAEEEEIEILEFDQFCSDVLKMSIQEAPYGKKENIEWIEI